MLQITFQLVFSILIIYANLADCQKPVSKVTTTVTTRVTIRVTTRATTRVTTRVTTTKSTTTTAKPNPLDLQLQASE